MPWSTPSSKELPLPSPDFGHVDAATRAKMLGNRRVDTKPELRLRSALHIQGLRFRKDYRVELGLGRADPRPDIAFTRMRLAVFVDGCFWHSCPEHGRIPARNMDLWTEKLRRNAKRDRRNDQTLREAGWQVVRIWEHVEIHEAVELVVARYRALAKADG